jgi:cysteine desulfurase / selenocysteine lyase
VIKWADVDDEGNFLIEEFEKLLTDRTKLVAITQMSNALGTFVPVKEVVKLAHARGIPVLVDGAQGAVHLPIDVQDLDCDFYVLSSHKMFGPTGTGVLYGRKQLLEAMPPYQGGGDMISNVTFEKTLYNQVPYKFEAGTPNIAGVAGFGAAIDYLMAIDRQAALAHEDDVLEYATERLRGIAGLRIIGEARRKTGVLSFLIDGVHPHDAGTILDQQGIAVRTGQHCAQPVMDKFCIPATIRVSLGIYNTREDIDVLVSGLATVKDVFA